MTFEDLPKDMLPYLEKATEENATIRPEVVVILLKLWKNEPISDKEKEYLIGSPEAAAILSVKQRHPFSFRTVQQAGKKRTGGTSTWNIREDVQLSRVKKKPLLPIGTIGNRLVYRLGDVLEHTVQIRRGKKEHD